MPCMNDGQCWVKKNEQRDVFKYISFQNTSHQFMLPKGLNMDKCSSSVLIDNYGPDEML